MSNITFDDIQNTFEKNVFIMMRYREDNLFYKIETTIRKSLLEYGLIARFAKDRAVSEDLWENIEIYINYSKYGLAVFEEINEREFNPNVSFELGYMYALKRRCLLLKDKRMPKMPTDILGKIYKSFDTYDIDNSLQKQINEWCEQDLKLIRLDSVRLDSIESYKIMYESESSNPNFTTWTYYSSQRFNSLIFFNEKISLIDLINSSSLKKEKAVKMSASFTEKLGFNKVINCLLGKVKFEYKAVLSGSKLINLCFYIIPMQEESINQHLVEVGANFIDDPDNGFSPYRIRYYVPNKYIGDNSWHEVELNFDFTEMPTAEYCIFAPRINEGCPKPGSGSLFFKNVTIYSKL